MTRDETLLLLEKISDAYPYFLKDRDPEKTADLWQQCLDIEKADDVFSAFIQYMRNDTRNQPPAPGSILQYVDKYHLLDCDYVLELPEELKGV